MKMRTSWKLNKTSLFGPNVSLGEDVIHVLNTLRMLLRLDLKCHFQGPLHTALNEPEGYAEECKSLDDWDANAVHKIPLIWTFMSSFGGCTNSGEIFWRLEDKQVVSLLVDGWFRESSPNAKKRSILMGSPGIGKSTLLCVMAFHLVFKHKKNVLVYRRLTKFEEENCLLYLGYEGDKVVYFSVLSCEVSEAKRIYRALRRQHGVSNVWLLLDGFRYQDIPEGVRTFKMLATSQQVDLKSQERTDAYCCLLPCWSKKDLWSMGGPIYKFATEDMEERFYYSGGSVREFTLATSENIRTAIDDAISGVDDVLNLLSNKSSALTVNLTGRSQVDHLCHTFVQDTNDTDKFTARRNWEQIIDSEYAVLALSVKLKADALLRIYAWAKSAGHGSLAGSVFEIYLHRLAADNTLKLYISEYDPPERRKPNEPRHFEVKQVGLRNGGAICCGTASEYENHLVDWRDDEKLTYWFPACHDFPNIDSVVKLESASGKKSNVAYLQITVAADHEIDSKQLQKMNAIFFPDDVKDAGDTERPLYIAVCPDLESCKAFVLKPPPEVLAARKTCRVFVGYYAEAAFATAADGPMNNVSVKALPPPPPYNFRKRRRTE
ncbi:Crinkler (CRN) [Phytophthora megakarya]|uniref:Crinkler (CRN) n=1 Tax=Phytophthora megakarya TaxID=4795 RepID=A0A225WZ19_9STRA|nr:Crinkler (CRN) [Phytophthora megakarya]